MRHLLFAADVAFALTPAGNLGAAIVVPMAWLGLMLFIGILVGVCLAAEEEVSDV